MKSFLIRSIGGIIMLAVLRAAAAAIPPLNNAFVRYLGVAEEIAPTISGTILALGYIFAVIGPLVAGPISDAKGSTKTFLGGGLLFVVFYALWTYAPTHELLYLYRVVLALGTGLVFIGIQKFLYQGAPEGKKGMGMGFYGIGFGVGAAVGPMLASLVVPAFGIVQAYYVLALAGLVAIVIGFVSVQIVRRMEGGLEDEGGKVQSEKEEKPSFFKVMVSQPAAVYLVVLVGIFVGVNNAAVFANVDDLGVSMGWEVGRGTMGVAIFAVFSFAMPLGGHLGDRFGSDKAILLGAIFLTVGFGGLALIANPIMIYPLMAIAGIGGIFFTPNSQALIGSYASQKLKGTLLSYLQGATGLGSAIGATVGGYLHSAFTVRTTFTMVLIAGILAVVAGIFLIIRRSRDARAAVASEA